MDKENQKQNEEELKEQVHEAESAQAEAGKEAGQTDEKDLTPEEKLGKELEEARKTVEELKDKYLRLSAEFDNFRKRTIKEKEASYGNGKADAVAKILPVYDNLERALQQETADAAFKKGVEMPMNELVKILTGLGVEIFGQVGDPFDPNLHNAVMHIESDELEENVIAQVFQKGFKIGDKIVRFAMVQVAN